MTIFCRGFVQWDQLFLKRSGEIEIENGWMWNQAKIFSATEIKPSHANLYDFQYQRCANTRASISKKVSFSRLSLISNWWQLYTNWIFRFCLMILMMLACRIDVYYSPKYEGHLSEEIFQFRFRIFRKPQLEPIPNHDCCCYLWRRTHPDESGSTTISRHYLIFTKWSRI